MSHHQSLPNLQMLQTLEKLSPKLHLQRLETVPSTSIPVQFKVKICQEPSQQHPETKRDTKSEGNAKHFQNTQLIWVAMIGPFLKANLFPNRWQGKRDFKLFVTPVTALKYTHHPGNVGNHRSEPKKPCIRHNPTSTTHATHMATCGSSFCTCGNGNKASQDGPERNASAAPSSIAGPAQHATPRQHNVPARSVIRCDRV